MTERIEALEEKLGKTKLIEEVYNNIIDGSLFTAVPIIQELTRKIYILEEKNEKIWELLNAHATSSDKLEDTLSKCGTMWDFRLDEQHGFIDKMKEEHMRHIADHHIGVWRFIKEMHPFKQIESNYHNINKIAGDIEELKESINIVADNSGNFEDMLLTKINELKTKTKVLQENIDYLSNRVLARCCF